MAVFSFFQLSCDMNHTVHIRGMRCAVHTRGYRELVVLVLLVVFLIFFSLFLQFVLRQRIVDIYICILRKELFVPSDGGATTWRFCLSEAHIGQNPSKNSEYLES